jgi:NADPH2 dehydrogenase/N-ethylmaleimide reductase
MLQVLKPYFTGCLIGNGGISPDQAKQLVDSGDLDMVAFGRQFISNPDLPARIKQGGPYAEARYVGWYGGNEEGYTDYPPL